MLYFFYISDSVNSDRQFLWRQANFNPHKIDIPEPIDKKLGTVDYVHERTPYTKFGTKYTHWGLLGKWVKYNKNIFLFIYTFFLRLAYRSDLSMDFYTR